MNKIKYVLTALAFVLFALIAARVDNRVFATTSATDRIQGEVRQTLKRTKEDREKLEAVYANLEDPRKYVLVDPELKKQEATVAVVKLDVLKVTGLMRTSEGVLAAVVNGSLVSPGDDVLGCDVKDISKDGVLFTIDGNPVLVPINGEFEFKAAKTGQMVLEQVVSQDGRNLAVFSGRFYKVGDWLNPGTQVKAVAPTAVMIDARGQSRILKIGDAL